MKVKQKSVFNLRFAKHPGLKEALQKSAKKNNRTLHAEIITRLQKSVEAEK